MNKTAIKAGWTVACLAFVACIVFATVYYYNQYEARLMWLDHNKAIWDSEIQRRASLLPNLIHVSAEYSEHEKALFEYVTQMRRYLDKAKGELASDTPDSPSSNPTLSSLLALAEKYPDLKATQSFELLMQGMVETTNRINDARSSYIASIKDLNELYAMFPSNIFGRLFAVANLKQWKYDASVEGERNLKKAVEDFLVARAETTSQPGSLPKQRPVDSTSAGHTGNNARPESEVR